MLPFSRPNQLVCNLEPNRTTIPEQATVPGQPLLAIHDSAGVYKLLVSELYAHDLESIAQRLWIMTTFSSANINPLHQQQVKGRKILVTEDPRLHLVWDHNRVFIKPIPRCLLSHGFWRMYLDKRSDRLGDSRERLQRVALGFLRTYHYLIQHESDLRIAQQDNLCLIPQDVDWPSFCRFASELANIEDADVSGRYCYGELRLTRLNIYAPVLLRKFQYEQIHGQYSDFFGRLFGPVLFVFAIVSIILNSIQVELAVEQLTAAQWRSFWMVSRWFSILSIGGACIIAAMLALLWLWVFLDEWTYTVRRKRAKRWRYYGQPLC
ncbi:MAG: hypothetical protein Q9165_005682 [Trypethelium subeluteriae]